MTNAIFDPTKVLWLNAGLNLITGDCKIDIMDLADYTFSASHQYRDDTNITTAVVGTTANLGSKTSVIGVFDFADTLFSALTGDECEALVLYRDSGAGDATSEVVAFMDTSVSGFPLTPNGEDADLLINAGGF